MGQSEADMTQCGGLVARIVMHGADNEDQTAA